MVNAEEGEVARFQLLVLSKSRNIVAMKVEMETIGRVETCYDEKFGVPRQPGLVPQAWGRVVFDEAYRNETFIRGIEGFSHLWLIFLFHKAPAKSGRGMVRPPRLGGNERRGVFATRAPYRPNSIGLSVVELVGVDLDHPEGLVLNLRGVDLVDGTPLLDVKPYVPFSDSVDGAVGGFVSGEPDRMPVVWDVVHELSSAKKELLEQTLALDPRPAYQEDEKRTYGCKIDGVNVRWKVTDGVCHVVELGS